MKTMEHLFLVSLFMLAWLQLPAEETQGKTRYALVTGASRGIGKEIVKELLRKDQNLIVFAVARGEADLRELKNDYLNRVIPITADIGQAEDLEKIQTTVRSMTAPIGLSYLIHNAAVIAPLGDPDHLQKQSLSSLLAMMETSYRTNVIAPHLLTLALLPELKIASDARVLFVSSRAGDVAVPGAVTYSCTKAALDHLALNFSSSLGNEIYSAPSGFVNFCGPSLDDHSSAILMQYGSSHDHQNLDHSEDRQNSQNLMGRRIAIGLLHPGEVDTDMQEDLRIPTEEQCAITIQFREAKRNHQLISPTVSAQFIVHLLYETSLAEFSEKKWDIYFVRPSNLPEQLSQAIGSPPPYFKPIFCEKYISHSPL